MVRWSLPDRFSLCACCVACLEHALASLRRPGIAYVLNCKLNCLWNCRLFCLLNGLLNCRANCIRIELPTYARIRWPTYRIAYVLFYLPIELPTYWLTYWIAYRIAYGIARWTSYWTACRIPFPIHIPEATAHELKLPSYSSDATVLKREL